MYYLIFVLFFVASFFILHALARRDFVLLRKNISTPYMFDLCLIVLLVGYVVGRIFYILDNNLFSWIHVIRFFHFLRLPGLSPFGVFFGVMLGTVIFLKDKRALLRVADIFSLSFIPYYLFSIIIRPYPFQFFVLKIATIAIFISVFYSLLVYNKNFSLRDGSITLVTTLIISLDTLLMRLYHLQKPFFYIFSFSEWISIVTIITCLVLLFLNEKILMKKA